MLSPEEGSDNGIRSAEEKDTTFKKYERIVWYFHKVEIAFLAFSALQLLFFFILGDFWFALDLHANTYHGLISIEINHGAAIFIMRFIFVLQIAITYIILKRLYHVISTETHNVSRVYGLLVAQIVLLNLIASYGTLIQTIVIICFWIALRKVHQAT